MHKVYFYKTGKETTCKSSSSSSPPSSSKFIVRRLQNNRDNGGASKLSVELAVKSYIKRCFSLRLKVLKVGAAPSLFGIESSMQYCWSSVRESTFGKLCSQRRLDVVCIVGRTRSSIRYSTSVVRATR